MKEAHSLENARVIDWLSKRGPASLSKIPLTFNQMAFRAWKGVVPKVRVEPTPVAYWFLSSTLVILPCHSPSQIVPFRS